MKNNFPALLLGTALMITSPVTVYAQSPATLSFPQRGQFRLSISNTDPNMIFIPGDKVTAITAQNGMLADKRLTSAGGVLFTSVANGVAAFTVLMGYIPFSSASYGIPGLLMLAGALLVWQVRDTLRPALFAVWLLLVALLNARHGDVMMFSGVILTLTVLFCVHGLVPASGRRLQAGRWFAPAYAIHLFFIGFLVRVL
uniref:TraK-X deletion and fusion protein n=2 Tax=Escherichia coli TaxID=562 RepID=Q2VP23_ECOLX|nr:type-F conjugative transfer system pilin acetylase TraX [Escherichia coli]CAI79515.1 TraK-X deletion and fusion protein [Escherichia coli]